MGEIRKQGITNTAIVYIGTIVGAFSLLVVQPMCLSKDELGLTRLVLSFATVLSSLLSFGIGSVTVRYMPRVLDHQRGHRGFLGFILGYLALSVSIGLLLLQFVRSPLAELYGSDGAVFTTNYRYVVILSASYSFVLGFNSYSLALLRSVFPTLLNDVVVRLMLILIILLHFYGRLDLHDFLLAFSLLYTLQAVVMLVYLFLVDRPRLMPDLAHINKEIGLRPLLRYGAIITFTAINSVTLKYLDSIFVGRTSLSNVAVYSVAAFIGLIIEVPLNALERIANPSIAHAMVAKDMKQIHTIYHRSSRFLLLLGGWMFMLVVLNVKDVLGLLPPGFGEGSSVAMVIALGALVNMATGINYPILANSDRYIYGSAFLIVLLIVTMVGNLLLIPVLGMMGAAITSCAANVIFNALKFEFIRRRFGMQPFDGGTVRILLLIAVITVPLCLIPLPFNAYVNVAVRALVASTIYLVAISRMHFASEIHEYLPARLKRFLT